MTLKDDPKYQSGFRDGWAMAHKPNSVLEQRLRAIIAHWDEFGPEHGFAEVVDRARDAQEVDPRADLEQLLINVAQLFDGWHADTAWTEWDESVRRHVSRWLGYVTSYRPPDAPAAPVSSPARRTVTAPNTVKVRIVEVLRKYNVTLEPAPLDALAMAMARMSDAIRSSHPTG